MTTLCQLLFTILLCFVTYASSAQQQDITNEGTDFWMAFTECHDLTTAVYQINVSSKVNTSGTVEIPGVSWSQNFNVTANQITKIILPVNDAVHTQSEVIINKGVHIYTNDLVVVYANTYHLYRSEASLVLPTPSLGNKYMISSYPTQNNGGLKQSEFMIVAAGDSVTVEINTTTNTENGHFANTPWTVTLDTGEIYMVQAQAVDDDFTGSTVRAVDPNQEFAVYNGHTWVWTWCFGNKDPLFEVAYPTRSWGMQYIALPSVLRLMDLIRVMALNDNTDIYIDGTWVANINAGQFYEDTISSATLIEGSDQICAMQYIITGQCDNAPVGDPAVVILNSNEQMLLDTITFFSIEEWAIDSNYVNIVMRTQDTSTLEFNFSNIPAYWTQLWQDTAYSWVRFRVDTGSHTLTTTSCGFLAYIYGMGYAESYYYAAGVRLNDLSDSLSFTNITTGSNLICETDTLQFLGQTGSGALAYTWYFGDGDSSLIQNPQHHYQDTGAYGITLIVEYLCQTDTVKDTLYVLPKPVVDLGLDTFICDPLVNFFILDAGNAGYNFAWSPGGQTTQTISVTQSGTYQVVVDNVACKDSAEITVTFAIEPVSSISVDPIIICLGDDISFSAFSDSIPVSWNWSFGDGDNSALQGPSHTFTSAGTYNYSLIIIYNCHTDTFTGMVDVLEQPLADLGPDTFLCFPVSYPLDAGNAGMVYEWSNGDDDQKIDVDVTGTYAVTVTNSFCFSEDEVFVDIPLKGTIPNVITPNGDGMNEEFVIGMEDRCAVYNLKVYNRWGRLLFETNDPLNEYWGATNNSGGKVKTGSYYFVLSSESYPAVTGFITVLR